MILIAFVLFGATEWVRWVGFLVFGFERAGPGGSGPISVIQRLPAALIIPFTSSLADRYPRTRVLACLVRSEPRSHDPERGDHLPDGGQCIERIRAGGEVNDDARAVLRSSHGDR